MSKALGVRNQLPRVLFVAEAVTLAHVARPAALIDCLDRTRFDTYFACDPRARKFLTLDDTQLRWIDSIESREFSDRLRRGLPLYDAATLQGYVEQDLALIDELRPDAVVGDFRLSLSVSARLAGVPYACIANAYWSPYALNRSLPLPVLPWTPYVPLPLAQRVFDFFQPSLLATHCQPLNDVRISRALAPLPMDLRRIYTDADLTLYADDPRIFPLREAPETHRHIGPVIWSPPVTLPPWWDQIDANLPTIYVTMGSSGNARMLEAVLNALSVLPVAIVASTAGATVPSGRWPNARIAEYLPGEQAAARSQLVVCNGGSPTSQQALAAGVPVLGICQNMDQLLNMREIAAAGLGEVIRADRFTESALTMAARRLLHAPKLNRAPEVAIAGLEPDGHTTAQRFRAALARLLPGVEFGIAPA